jgi:lambda family phage minor tail protein L
MRTLNGTSKTEKNKSANQPIFLYTIYDYDGASNNLTLAEYDTDIVYPTSGGLTYTRFPITHEFVGENSSGEIDTIRIKLSNISRLIQGYLEIYDLRGKKVKITLVWANQLADADAKVEHIYYIDSYTANENDVELVLSSKFDVLDIQIPLRTYSRNYCLWKFKSTECGYSNGETSCNKTLARCRVIGNNLRFGGFPSIPNRRVYIR